MRDLKRSNAKMPAYKQLEGQQVVVFTPMKWRVPVKGGKRIREKVPVIQDLLFVYGARDVVDSLVARIPTLQYRYIRGAYCEPMVVHREEMNRFIRVVQSTDTPCFFRPEELTEGMRGRMIRIVGGPLDGYEGRLLVIRGSRVKRVLVELPSLLSVAVEVNPEYIQLLSDGKSVGALTGK